MNTLKISRLFRSFENNPTQTAHSARILQNSKNETGVDNPVYDPRKTMPERRRRKAWEGKKQEWQKPRKACVKADVEACRQKLLFAATKAYHKITNMTRGNRREHRAIIYCELVK